MAVIGSARSTFTAQRHGGYAFAVCGSTQGESYRHIVVVGIAAILIALVVVIVIGSMVGSFRTQLEYTRHTQGECCDNFGEAFARFFPAL
jgi:uncharacterized membrane protein